VNSVSGAARLLCEVGKRNANKPNHNIGELIMSKYEEIEALLLLNQVLWLDVQAANPSLLRDDTHVIKFMHG
jgi:hypothetical protein